MTQSRRPGGPACRAMRPSDPDLSRAGPNSSRPGPDRGTSSAGRLDRSRTGPGACLGCGTALVPAWIVSSLVGARSGVARSSRREEAIGNGDTESGLLLAIIRTSAPSSRRGSWVAFGGTPPLARANKRCRSCSTAYNHPYTPLIQNSQPGNGDGSSIALKRQHCPVSASTPCKSLRAETR